MMEKERCDSVRVHAAMLDHTETWLVSVGASSRLH